MNTRPLVFLDMDGVLVDFLGGVCERFNMDLSTLPTGIYDLPTLLGVPWEAIDSKLDNVGFWRDLKPMAGAKDVLDVLNKAGRVIILSSPWPQSAKSHAGKLDWCENVLGIPHSDVILTPYKHLLAGPGRLLVDDSFENCHLWSSYGGYAIRMPCHHNVGSLAMLGPTPADHLCVCIEQMMASIQRNQAQVNEPSRN